MRTRGGSSVEVGRTESSGRRLSRLGLGLGLVLALATLATFAAGTIGCSPGAARAEPATPARTFTFRLSGEPETLDWNKAHTPIETYLLMNVMEGLLTFNAKLEPAPSLAESWNLSKDGRTYTFKLRSGVKWSDGVPLRAADFVFSWKRLLTRSTAASYAYFLFDVEGAEDFFRGKQTDFARVGISAPDDRTLVVRLTRPVATWIYVPTFWVTFPMREDVVQKYGNSWATPGRIVTLGPYSLFSHEYDSKIVLHANPTYWGAHGNIEQVTGLVVKEDSTALTLYEAGKLDFLTDIATLDLRRLAGRADLKTFPYLKTGYLGFLVDKFPLNSAKFRRAVAQAIDRSKLGEILHGGQTAAQSFVPPGMMGHSPTIGLKFDPMAARRDLSAAGIELGTSLKLDILLPNADKQTTLAQYIQGELKKNLGLDVSLQPFDNKTYRAQLDLRVFPLFEGSWSADYPDPDNFLSVFLGDSGNNRTNWANARFDDLVRRARSLMEKSPRIDLYLQAQRLLQEEDAVILPLYYEPNMALVRPRVHGLELNPLNYLLLRKVTLDR